MDKQPSRDWIWALALVLMTLVAYLPAMRAGWIWDDDYYVTGNACLRSVAGLHDIWFKLGAVPQYYPATHTTFWIEHHLWGLWPVGYHVDNILLHAGSAVLLWMILRRLVLPGAWFVAAIWAVHPVNVESVAWVTERKNVLSGCFYLAALLCYLRFDESRSRGAPKPRWGAYALALLLFVLALLSKSVTASLPTAALLIVWWKRGAIRWRDVWPLLPMLAIGAASSVLTSHMERTVVGATGPAFAFSAAQRLLIAGRAAWFYTAKILLPAKLAFIYPKWVIDPQIAWQWAFPLAAAALVVVLWMLRKRIGRGGVVAALFFGGTLLPALGFVNVLPMRYSYVADHFQYLASIGLIALVVAPASRWKGMRTLGAAVLLVLIVSTMVRQQAFMNLSSLWQDTLAKNPDGSMPNNNYATLLMAEHKLDEAEVHLRRAIVADANNFEAVSNLGTLLESRGENSAAMAQYRKALAIEPRYAIAQYNLGRLLLSNGQAEEAMAYLAAAIASNPRYPDAYRALAVTYERQQQMPQAIEELRRAVKIDPTDSDVRVDLSRLLARQGDLAAAVDEAEMALQLDASNASAHNQQGMLLEAQGNTAAAAAEYQRALQLRPDFAQAQRNWQRVRDGGRAR